MKKTDETFLKKIKKYAKRKTWVLVIALLLVVISLLLGGIFAVLEGLKVVNVSVALVLYLVFVSAMVAVIILITHYEKVREKLVEEVGTNSLREFFDYFCNVGKKDYIYYEVKDIFMYGLWRLKDKNTYLKIMSEDENYIFEIDEIRRTGITKKEILAASMFRCLTFKKDGLIFRNQKIFLDQNKFLEILNQYAKIYQDSFNHREEYIAKCSRIEEIYRKDKEIAKAEYNGLPKGTGRWERFVVFSNNPNSVRVFKKALVVAAMVSMLFLCLAQFEMIPVKYKEEISFIVTCVFNLITIVLLLVDIAKKDEKELLHL